MAGGERAVIVSGCGAGGNGSWGINQWLPSGTTIAERRLGWCACDAYLREGDTLVVYALDRLGRSTIDVLTQINSLSQRGVRLVILIQGFDTHTPAGKLALTMFAAFAEFEHSIRKERQQEGILRARSEGKYAGRKPKLTLVEQEELLRRYQAGENRSELARQFGIDRVTVHRYSKLNHDCRGKST